MGRFTCAKGSPETLARLSEEAALFGFVVVDVVIEKCPTAVLGEPEEYTRVRSMPQTVDPERRWKATTIGNRGSTTLIRKPLRFYLSYLKSLELAALYMLPKVCRDTPSRRMASTTTLKRVRREKPRIQPKEKPTGHRASARVSSSSSDTIQIYPAFGLSLAINITCRSFPRKKMRLFGRVGIKKTQ